MPAAVLTKLTLILCVCVCTGQDITGLSKAGILVTSCALNGFRNAGNGIYVIGTENERGSVLLAMDPILEDSEGNNGALGGGK